MKRIIDKIYIGMFCFVLFVPFFLAHRENGRVSDMENRALANPPDLRREDGRINWEYPEDFDKWLNDNVRFRTILMEINATLQYELFEKVANNNLRQGEEGHLYYVDSGKVQEYQHVNLLSEKELNNYTNSMQKLNNYLCEKGIVFYYMQCYDKDSIYPEYYVEGVRQFGNVSRANQIVAALEKNTDIKVVPIYEELIKAKNEDLLYFKATDPAHWNEPGAYIGYTALINTIKSDFPEAYYLEEEAYIISEHEEYANIYGFTYPYPDYNLRYKIREPKAIEIDLNEFDPQKIIRYREYGHYYVNSNCDNDLKIMVVGDSYIRQFLKEDIAESFSETLSIDWINLTNLDRILEIYEPDIVVFESAEFFLNQTIPLVNEITYTEF